jgi:5-methylcytosine-specific restriction protein A
MPKKSLRPCRIGGCSGLTREGSYCPKHQNHNRRAPDRRISSWKRGYNSEYKKIRAKLLKNQPFCRLCGRKSTVAHHIPDYVVGTSHKGYDYWALCECCHNRIKKGV